MRIYIPSLQYGVGQSAVRVELHLTWLGAGYEPRIETGVAAVAFLMVVHLGNRIVFEFLSQFVWFV